MRQNQAKDEIIQVEGGRIARALGRKDRHSKVCTSKGLRDRRVRLSADIAIQFYDIQDKLGYDRPSKAIDWLMKEAKTAIDALNSDSDHRDRDLLTSVAIHRTPGERTQQISTHDEIGGFNNNPFCSIDSRNKHKENPIEELSPMDFTWDPSYESGEGFELVDREPLQSSYPTTFHTFNKGFVDDDLLMGFNFQQENQLVEEDEHGDQNEDQQKS